jgi:siroheme synthase-like protein
MSALYPVLLKLDGKRCVVIGGGAETGQRVAALVEAGAEVTLIAPSVSEHLADHVHWEAREYRAGDLDGAFLAVACLADRSRNAKIWAEAEARGIPFNATDDSAHCTFVFPAIHRQGDLVVAVSSSGKSPALASRLRDRMARQLGPEYAEFLDLLSELRPEVGERFPGFERRREVWYRLVDSDAFDHLKAGRREDARAALRKVFDAA